MKFNYKSALISLFTSVVFISLCISLMAQGTNCLSAVQVFPGTYTADGPSTGSTSMACSFPISGSSTHSDWYVFTTATSGLLSVSSCGSAVDTRLSILTPGNFPCISTFNCFAADDDGCPGNSESFTLASKLENLEVEPGILYYIVWDNRWSEEGFEWNLDFVPFNDKICNAQTIQCGDLLPGSTLGADGSDLGTPSCTNGIPFDVFYTFSAVAGNTYTITCTGANYDAVLAIFSGNCSSTLTELECADSGIGNGTTETIVYTAESSTEIIIQTYDWYANKGDFSISLDCSYPNETPCSASPISCGVPINAISFGADNTSNIACSNFLGTQQDLYYTFTAQAGLDYSITLSGSGYDGVLAAYVGNCSGTLSSLTCSNTIGEDPETIVINETVDTEIFLQVYDLIGAGNGNFTLIMNCEIPNDDICEATNIIVGETLFGSTYGASVSSLGQPTCSNGSANDVFYSFTALAGNTYSITNNGDNYDAVLAIFSGNCFGVLTELDCADTGLTDGEEEEIIYTASATQTIFIQTYDWSSTRGEFNISVQLDVTNDFICDAIEVNCNSVTSGTTIGADIDDYAPNCAGAAISSPGVWFYFNPDSDGFATFSLCEGTDYDTKISVYTATICFTALTCLAGNDQSSACGNINQSQITDLPVNAGTNYYILVHGFNGATGNFDLNITCTGSASNTLSGTALWNSSCGSRAMTIKLYTPGTALLFQTYATTINSAGVFSLTGIPAGTYDVFVKVNGFLQKGFANRTIATGVNNLSVGAMVNGDIDNSNGINGADFSVLSASYLFSSGSAGFNANADLDCSGGVNGTDFSILSAGYLTTGDVPPLF